MNRITFDPEVLRVARHTLEIAGFKVSTAPPDLLEAGCALLAHRSSDDTGYFVAFAELGHVVHYGACYLWAGAPSSDPPAWEHRDARARLETALSKWCLEVATAPDGLHQDTLHRKAFSVGGLVASGQVSEDEARERLERAGLETGMDAGRVKATVKRSLERGAKAPWSFEDRPQAPKANPSGKPWQSSRGGW
jgi:hypothetical protein